MNTAFPVRAKTVADLSAVVAWPDGLILDIHIGLDPRLSVVRVEQAPCDFSAPLLDRDLGREAHVKAKTCPDCNGDGVIGKGQRAAAVVSCLMTMMMKK